MTTEKQIQNAIVWINALDPKEGFKKTTGRLGRELKDKTMTYCCLGVGCKVLDLPVDFDRLFSYELIDQVGLNDVSGLFLDPKERKTHKSEYLLENGNDRISHLTDINDIVFKEDTDFSGMRTFILENLQYIFVPQVAEGLKKHYNKN